MAMKCEIILLFVTVIGIVSGGMVHWKLEDDKNNSCVMVQFDGAITLLDPKNKTVTFDLSSLNYTIEEEKCAGVSASSQNMTVDLSKHGKLEMLFTQTKENNVSLVFSYTFQSKELFPDETDKTVTLKSVQVFTHVPAAKSYTCLHMEELELKDKDSGYTGTLRTSNATIQAFDIKNNKFGPAEHCGDDKSSTTASTTTASTTTASTTTAMSTTVPPPVMKTFKLVEKNVTCILLYATIQFQVDYMTNKKKTGHGEFNIPDMVAVSGTCATDKSDSATMILTFGKNNSTLTLSFADDKKEKTSMVKEINAELKITNATFSDAVDQTLNGTSELKLKFSDNTYYICDAGSSITMKNINVSMGHGWKAQAFNLKNGNFSGEGDHCPADTVSSTTASTPLTTTPSPNPVNNYTVYSDNGTICIFMKASMEFNISYTSTDPKHVNKSHMVYVSSDAKASGDCDISKDVQLMTISFGANMNAAGDQAELGMLFVMDKNNKYTISNLTLTMSSDVLPDVKKNETMVLEAVNANLFQAAKDGSYLCNSQSTVGLSNAEKNATIFFHANLMIKDLQYKAFNTDNSTTFKDVVECSADNDTNSIVPIAVGAALAGLVVIVLIAYLIGRRRSKRYGYESV